MTTNKIHLTRISTTAGHLEHSDVTFSPRLNCVIGARGTCKSTLIETIRFAIGAGDAARQKYNSESDLIATTLGPGTAQCEIENIKCADAVNYTIQREISTEPRLYRDGVREHEDKSILDDLIEIYSQGELLEIANNPIHRLELIDKPNRAAVALLRNRQATAVSRLESLGVSLRDLRLEFASFTERLRPAEEVSRTLQELRDSAVSLPPELEERRLQHQRNQRLLTALEEARKAADNLPEALAPLQTFSAELRRRVESARAIASPEASPVLGIIDGVLASSEQAFQMASSTKLSEVGRLLDDLKVRFDEAAEPYFKLLQQEREHQDVLRREAILERQEQDFSQLKQEVLQKQEHITRLLQERSVQRAIVNDCSSQIYSLRSTEVDSINSRHHANILLTLSSGSFSLGYRQALSKLLQGSRIRNQEDVVADICSRIPPDELIDLVEKGDASSLAGALGRDLGQMNRLASFLADHEELYILEREIGDDTLDITMFDNGEAKPVETLSNGQKATALLPLILRPLPIPLIFDQPEDDLDNRFIIQGVIDVIRELKLERQLIFVTHNANIPVLGDAETVIVMQMETPSRAQRPRIGTVDTCKEDILSLLEGGAEAFKHRRERYASLVG